MLGPDKGHGYYGSYYKGKCLAVQTSAAFIAKKTNPRLIKAFQIYIAYISIYCPWCASKGHISLVTVKRKRRQRRTGHVYGKYTHVCNFLCCPAQIKRMNPVHFPSHEIP